MFATIRAADIVRDADILPLYKKAGIDCVLMGMETTDPATIAKIRKGSTTRTDLEAIRLLRRHGMLSMVGHIVGFEEERLKDYWNALRQLLVYDPDLLNAMYVTPHRWTGFYNESRDRDVVEGDQSKWDYRHQVLGTRYLKPWHIFLLVKATELAVQLRPRALWRVLFYPDAAQRRAYRWCFRNAGRVWRREVYEFFFKSTRIANRQSLANYAGEPIMTEAALVPLENGRSPYHR
jgi:anaerobic magnesium-protoporphyrin IX monomethyl ester cyclase